MRIDKTTAKRCSEGHLMDVYNGVFKCRICVHRRVKTNAV